MCYFSLCYLHNNILGILFDMMSGVSRNVRIEETVGHLCIFSRVAIHLNRVLDTYIGPHLLEKHLNK